MNSITESFEKVAKKQRLLAIETDSCLDAMIANLNACQDNPQAVAQLLSNTKAMAAKLSDSAKDFHNTIGKYSKAIEKKFKTDLDGIWDPKALEGKEYVLYQILVMHFVREGRFDLAKMFAREAGIDFEEGLHAQFEGMFHIQEALRNEDISLALEWAMVHHKSLVESGSTFEFNLHKLKYLGYIRKGDIKSALAYAKQNFAQFATKHIKGIQ
ncbi:E3 ubiquitin-protein transferase rmnd5a [Boothiomyces sp. JEL0838]|nr:E3 ubiquitin-protein transferase rmnd5a [Boothiomyces sp. JEL0838]